MDIKRGDKFHIKFEDQKREATILGIYMNQDKLMVEFKIGDNDSHVESVDEFKQRILTELESTTI
jgi:hypothetical protein